MSAVAHVFLDDGSTGQESGLRVFREGQKVDFLQPAGQYGDGLLCAVGLREHQALGVGF